MRATLFLLLLLPGSSGPDPRATKLLDNALTRMGGAPALQALTRVRLEMLTQWQRTAFDGRPYNDMPSYELHSERRDYATPAWRNSRKFFTASTWREITDIVRDTVAIRQMNGAWAPLNVAYVDERREVFTFAPERLLLAAREADDLRVLPDTMIAGLAHARLGATVNGFPATLLLRRGDGLLAMVRYVAAQPNDFGLVPWGRMEVEVWYSRWGAGPNGVSLPMQWDVRRVGRPYKRMTVLALNIDTTSTADTFAVSDSLRQAFFQTANRPMQDVPLDSARMAAPGLARFGGLGYPPGAIKVGRSWVLIESGQASINAERSVEWLKQNDPGSEVAGAVLTIPAGTNGGAVWATQHRLTLHVSPAATPFVRTILQNQARDFPRNAEITRAQWLKLGGDSLWLEPIDLPDAPGSLLVYAPSHKWAYAATATSPLHQSYLVDRLKQHGWPVERLGSIREIWGPALTGQSASR